MLAKVAKLFSWFSLFYFLKRQQIKTGKSSWLLKECHAKINKGVVFLKKKGQVRKKGRRSNEEG